MPRKRVTTQVKGREDLPVMLKEAQSRFGHVPREVMAALAESFTLPINDVYGIVSFYSFLSVKPLGRNVIRICQSLPCYLKHGQVIMETVAKELGIKPGETTNDGKFSFQLTNCIGQCDRAPAMMVNQDIHVDLTPVKIAQILKGYK